MYGVRGGTLLRDSEFANLLFAGIAGAVGCCGGGRGLEVGAVLVGSVVALAERGDQLIRVDLSHSALTLHGKREGVGWRHCKRTRHLTHMASERHGEQDLPIAPLHTKLLSTSQLNPPNSSFSKQ